jgi:hemerythrin
MKTAGNKEEHIMENISLNDMQLVGNELLDTQHKIIFSNMAKVYGYLLSEKKGRELLDLLDKLDAYCKLHFLDEEKVMSEMGLPDLEEHKAQHMLFIRHLEIFMGRYEEMSCTRSIDELNFLKGWFQEHIMAFDRKCTWQKSQFNEARVPRAWSH